MELHEFTGKQAKCPACGLNEAVIVDQAAGLRTTYQDATQRVTVQEPVSTERVFAVERRFCTLACERGIDGTFNSEMMSIGDGPATAHLHATCTVCSFSWLEAVAIPEEVERRK